MLTNTEVVVQDQLIASGAGGKVRVHYPRGSNTLISIGSDGVIQSRPDSSDGAWEQATVLPNGNLLYLSDTPTSIGTVILGANLKAL